VKITLLTLCSLVISQFLPTISSKISYADNPRLSFPSRSNPFGIAVNPTTNTIYVADFGSNTVSVINGSSNTVVTTIAVGTQPTGIAVNEVINTIYITNKNGS
jgi:YVTN family beta-propeller protein